MKTIHTLVGSFGVVAILLMSGGCTYTFPDYPITSAASYQNHLEQDGIIVAIKPITNVSEQKLYFDTNLNSRNILPVFVVVENHHPQDSILVSKEDIGLYGVSNSSTENMLSSGDSGKTVELMGAVLLSTPIMAIGGAFVADAENIKHNFRAKKLTRQMLSTDQATSGFVYFPLLKQDKSTNPDLLISVKLKILPSNEQKTFLLRTKW